MPRGKQRLPHSRLSPNCYLMYRAVWFNEGASSHLGSMKIRAHCTTYMEKSSEKYFNRNCLQTNVQRRYFVAVIGRESISSTIKRTDLEYFGTNCPRGRFAAEITPMPHNPILSRYLTCLDDFNFIRHMPIPNRNGQVCRVYESRKSSMLIFCIRYR